MTPVRPARQQSSSVAEANDLRPIVVGTEEGVYYTEDLSASSPVWQDLNAGLVVTADKTIKAMWMETYARPDWWTGVLWAGTYSGIWMLANPFAGGTWEKRLDRDEFWDAVKGTYTPDVYSFQVVAVEGSLDAYGPMYALGRRTAITDALTHTTTYGYDGLGRTAAITDANSGVTRYAYVGLGRQTAITDAAGVATYSTYDTLGRLAETEDALGHAAEYAYDALGNRTVLTDANGLETRYGYDAQSRLITVTEAYSASGPVNEWTNVTTWYGYDGVGNRVVITDANSHATSYAYDDLDRLVQASDPLTHTTVYTYDRVSNRTVVTDADEQATTYTVDALNRVTEVGYADGSVEYAYDRVGNRTAMTDATGVTTWAYDALYRPLTVTAPATGTVGYVYDAAGNRTRLAYPDGQVVTYTYDPANRLVEVEDWQAGTTEYEYDQAGRLLTVTLANGVQTGYGYDGAGRLTTLRHELEGATLAAYTYTLDAVGNRVQAGEEVSGTATTITYTYDALQRLTGADYSDGKSFIYAYDAAGNRTAYTETITTSYDLPSFQPSALPLFHPPS